MPCISNIIMEVFLLVTVLLGRDMYEGLPLNMGLFNKYLFI